MIDAGGLDGLVSMLRVYSSLNDGTVGFKFVIARRLLTLSLETGRSQNSTGCHSNDCSSGSAPFSKATVVA